MFPLKHHHYKTPSQQKDTHRSEIDKAGAKHQPDRQVGRSTFSPVISDPLFLTRMLVNNRFDKSVANFFVSHKTVSIPAKLNKR